jgi:hypothetical protein
MWLLLLLGFFQLQFASDQHLSTENTVDPYKSCVNSLSSGNWKTSADALEQRMTTLENNIEKASLSLCLGDYYSGLIDGPVGQLDLYKSFYYYLFASSYRIPLVEKAQYMIGFLLSIHPEVAPEPFSVKVCGIYLS